MGFNSGFKGLKLYEDEYRTKILTKCGLQRHLDVSNYVPMKLNAIKRTSNIISGYCNNT